MSTTAASAQRQLTQRQAVEAALGNEQLTRERVERLEQRFEFLQHALCDATTELARHTNVIRYGSLRDRLKWLITGDFPGK